MIRKFTLVIFITTLSMIAMLSNATNYYSQGNLAMSTTTNWNSNMGGGGSNPSNFVTSGDSFFIQSTHTMSGSWSSAADVVLNVTGIWNTAGGTVGSIIFDPSGSVTLAANLNVKNNWTNNGSFNPATYSVSFNGNTSQTLETGGTGTGKTFRNITFANVNQPITLSNDLLVTYGLTISANGIFSASSFNIYIGTNWINSGTFNAGTSNVIFNGTGTQSINSGGSTSNKSFYDLTINKSGGTISLANNLLINHNFNFSSTTGIFNSGIYTIDFSNTGSTCTINGNIQTANLNGFSGTTSTTIVSTNTPSISLGSVSTVTYTASSGTQFITNDVNYARLTKANGATAELTGDIIVNSNLTISGGTLSTSANNYNIQVGGNWTNNATFYPGTSTVTFVNTTTQTLTSGGSGTGKSFYNLIVNNSATLNLVGNLMIDNDLTITTGTLNAAAYTIDFSASGKNCIINGTFLTSNLNGFSGGTSTAIISSNSPTITLGSNSTITYSAASGTQTLTVDQPYANLTKSGAGTAQLAGNLTVNGNLNIAAGILSTSSSNYSIEIKGNWTNSGTFTEGTGTVSFTGTSDQTIYTGGITAAKAFYNIDINKSSGFVFLGGALLTNNAFSITAGGFDVSTSNYAMTIAGDWTNNGTFVPQSGIVTFNGSAQTINTGGSGSGKSFYNLTYNKAAGTATLNGDIKIENNFTISAGTFDVSASNYNMIIGNNWANTGTFTPHSGTVTFNSSSDQVINTSGTSAGKSFNNIIIENTSSGPFGAYLVAYDILITGNLTINSGATFSTWNGTTNRLISVQGNWINNGTFNSSNGTVIFQGTSAQTINAGGTGSGKTFYNITINKAASSVTLGSEIKILNNFTITAGQFDVSSSNYSMYVGHNWANTGSFIPQSGTVYFNGNLDQSINSGGISRPFNNITINNTSAGTLGAYLQSNAMKINGNLTINSGNQFSAWNGTTSYAVYIGGNWTNDGTFNAAAGNITFDGIGNQLITTGGIGTGKTFYDLSINKSAGSASLDGIVKINRNFTLTAGTFDVTSNNYTMIVGGNWISAGTFTAGSGIVNFVGSVSQTINTGGTGTGKNFYDIVVDLSSGSFSLGSNIGISNMLTLTRGSVLLNSRQIIYSTNASLKYNGATTQTSSNGEFPATNGPDNLILDNLNGLNLTFNRTINGSLTLTNGALNLGTYTLSFQNSSTPIVLVNGTLSTGTTSGLTFGTSGNTGGAAFTLPNNLFTSSPASIGTFTINRTNSITFGNQAINLSGSLVLTSGIIVPNGSNTFTLLQGATVSGANASSYINGPINIQRTNTGAFTANFPVGKTAIGYRPLTFTFNQTTSSPTTYMAEYFSNGAPTLTEQCPIPAGWAPDVNNYGYWSISDGGANNFTNGSVSLTYGTNDVPGTVPSAGFTVAKSNPSSPTQWINIRNIGSPVTGTSGTITSNIIFSDLSAFAVAPLTNLTITSDPSSDTKCVGGNVTFSVSATGSGTISYQWLHNNSIISGANSNTYSINPVAGSDSGLYSCIVSNSCFTDTSNSAVLTVQTNPAVSVNPSNSTICTGSNTSFSISATGYSISYQWQENTGSSWADISNGGVYSNVTTNTLTLTNPSTSMNGYTYRCVVTGGCGSPVNSNPATLTVNANPVITAHPSNPSAVCEGTGTPSFSVTATGFTLSYQWQENTGSSWADITDGGVYSNATTASLTITNPSLAMNGYTYRCVVTGGCGSPVNSNPATLTVNANPVITAHPSNPSAVCEGTGTPSFSVTATGFTLSYQWQENTGSSWADITDGGVYSNATTASLTITNPTLAMNGYTYRCVVTGACASAVNSNPATLTVNANPVITAHPSNPSAVCEGTGTPSFSVTATGFTLSYQWQENTGSSWADITDGGVYSNATTASLTITNPTLAMNGYTYRCVVTGACASAVNSNPATLTVNANPVITAHPSDPSAVCEGTGTPSFSVTATGFTLSYQWQENTGSSWADITDGGVYSNATTASLTITNPSLAMNGYTYRCVVTGACASAVNSNPATLTVNANPVITAHPSNPSAVCEGTGTPSFSVTATGFTLSYQWQGNTGSSWADITDGGVYSNATTASLTITNPTLAMNGYTYRCVVTGACASAVNSNPATLTVNANPVITAHPSNPSAVCEGTGTPSFSVTATGFTLSYQWQENTGSSWADITDGGVYSNATTASLTITNPTLAMNGYTYRCVVTGACASAVNSNPATLTVNANPVITAHPSNPSAVCEGTGTPSFSVTATGFTLSYQWQENTGSSWADITDGGVYSNATTASLTITNPTLAMNGYTYRCVVTGACASAVNSNPATLTVNANPVITAHPSNPSAVCEGTGTPSFSVTATGFTLSYQWQENTGSSWADISNGGVYSNATTASLTITNPTLAMNGYTYRCVVTGACASAVNSNPATLTVNANPVITAHPSDPSAVCEGTGTPSFSVTATGFTLSYQWQENTGSSWADISNGGVYSNATTASLTITNPTLAMNGYTYRCVVTGACASAVNSNPATLTVNANPVITAHPSNPSAVCEGTGTPSFSVTATGFTLSYQWQENTGSSWADITDGGVYSNATTASLTITNPTLAMNGYTYRCVVTGACASAVNSNPATLTVNANPVITAHPGNSTICSGGNTSFSVTASGTGISYLWQENQGSGWNNLSNGGVYSTVTTATLNLTAATSGMNSYQYRCIVSGTCTPDATSNAAILSITVAPSVTSQPTTTTICEGDNTSFTISASGSSLTYQWQEDQGSGWNNLSNTGIYSNVTTSTLDITAAPASLDGYLYRCVVSGACSPVANSNSAMLFINTLPNITSDPVNSSVFAGDTTTFSISATGSSLTYQWQEDQGSGWSNLSNSGIYTGVTTSILTISGASSAMNGYTYRCIVSGTCTPDATSNSATLSVNFPTIDVKIYLQGPWNGTTMNTSLNSSIPLTAPYNAAPWNFATKTASSVPATAVDWVVVELRHPSSGIDSDATSSTVVARNSGFLLNNGNIRDVDGTSLLTFNTTDPGPYYVVVYHRNHLPVMSSVAIARSSSYDFTTAVTTTYGTNALKQVGSIYTLWAGDVTRNFEIKYNGTGNDRTPILSFLGGTGRYNIFNSGYVDEDINLDNAVIWNTQAGYASDRDIILNNLPTSVSIRIAQLP